MEPSRRTMLLGALALLAVPLRAMAEGPPSTPDTPDLPEVIVKTQAAMLGFDLGEVVAKGAERLGLPNKHIRAWREAVGDRLVGKGLRAVDVFDADPALAAAVGTVIEDAFADLRVKLRFRKLIRALSPKAGTLEPLIDAIASELLGLDVAGLRAHRETLQRDGLVIIYGGAQDLTDVLGTLSTHLMTLFLEGVHGRKAKVVYGQQPMADLLHPLLDPEIRVVAFVGHGHWSEFSTSGPGGHPDETWGRLVRALHSDLRGTTAKLMGGKIYEVLPWKRGGLREVDLALLVDAWFPNDDAKRAAQKDLVVRYTCGTKRYGTRAFLLWEFLPDALKERSHIEPYGRGISPASPEDDDWNSLMAEFLADHPASVTGGDALGTSIVGDARNTRGYPGLSWLDDFMERPIPAFKPTPDFAKPPDAQK